MDSWLLKTYAEIEAIKADIEAMKALNAEREQHGYSLAYDENAFAEKANSLREISTSINVYRNR